MIVGRVNANLEATVQLQIEDSSGRLHAIDTIIDTGFTGDVTLRSAQISALSLSWFCELDGRLADGTLQKLDAYDAVLRWDGNPVQVKIFALETDSLLGTHLLAGHELKTQFVDGGAVTIERIP